jgi:hypothetical protein
VAKHTLYYDLIDAAAEPGCPVCHLSIKSTRRYLDSVIYEYVNDPGVRDDLRAARGYCNKHAWWLTDIPGSALGVAIVYKDIVQSIAGAVDALPDGNKASAGAEGLLERLRPAGACPACKHRDVKEEHLLNALLKNIDDERLATALTDSSGLCLPHLVRALELVEDNRTLRRLAALQQDKLARLQDELSEFIRKSDYRFQAEGFGQEGNSWRRALALVSGEPGVR